MLWIALSSAISLATTNAVTHFPFHVLQHNYYNLS